jgi:hypothetical protein
VPGKPTRTTDTRKKERKNMKRTSLRGQYIADDFSTIVLVRDPIKEENDKLVEALTELFEADLEYGCGNSTRWHKAYDKLRTMLDEHEKKKPVMGVIHKQGDDVTVEEIG